MRRIRWRWVLPFAQLVLAVTAWFYAPLQYLAAIQEVHARYPNQNIQLGLDFYERNWPSPAERVVLALNFPAVILAGPFNLLFHRPLYADQLRDVSVRDIAFFCWIGILWYWVGSKLDHRNSNEDQATHPPGALDSDV